MSSMLLLRVAKSYKKLKFETEAVLFCPEGVAQKDSFLENVLNNLTVLFKTLMLL